MKKPRFDVRNPSALVPDALEEDAVLEADEIGKRGHQTKRNAVNIDGYESDSSNEGFGARAEAKSKTVLNGTDDRSTMIETDDMFADPEGQGEPSPGDIENAAANKSKKRKDVRFVEVDKIEGQIAGSKAGGHVSGDFSLSSSGRRTVNNQQHQDSESSSESEVDDETRAAIDSDVDEEIGAGGKKKHAPKLDAFNLKAEKEGGGFDDQLNYVRKATDPDAVHDIWLQGVSKKDMKKARDAEEKREEEQRRIAREADSILTSDILKTLIPYLERGETPLEALARLGMGKTTKKPKWQPKLKNKRKGSGDMDFDVEKAPSDPEETRRRHAVETLTGVADALLTRGQNDIYDTERESLMRQYRREAGEDWLDLPTQDIANEEDEADKVRLWEYRWNDARDGGEAHGPYNGAMMMQWNEAGYFGEGVEFRMAGDNGAWSRSVDFL